MLKWFRKTDTKQSTPDKNPESEKQLNELVVEEPKLSSWQRLKDGLRKTRQNLLSGFGLFFKNHTDITDEYWDEFSAPIKRFLSSRYEAKLKEYFENHYN